MVQISQPHQFSNNICLTHLILLVTSGHTAPLSTVMTGVPDWVAGPKTGLATAIQQKTQYEHDNKTAGKRHTLTKCQMEIK